MDTRLPAYLVASDVASRAITAENPTGAKGAGGSAGSALGPGRKGRPCLTLPAGSIRTLAEIEGPGVIRHVWVTVPEATPAGAFVLRDLVLRAHWDGAAEPSIEVPLGDFFCNGFGQRTTLVSLPVVVAPAGGMNCYLPMPFRHSARLTLESEHAGDIDTVFYQVDYSVGDDIAPDVGYLCAQWRRSRPAPGSDHTIVDDVRGTGSYVGTYIALTALGRFWWGEGEVKFFLDGDTDLPTICGTGLEDYVGGAWAFQDRLAAEPEPVVRTFSAPYFGYPHRQVADASRQSPFATAMPPTHGLYRWHLPDPIRFTTDLRATLQQIGQDGFDLFERSDDLCTTAYWYQVGTPSPFPDLPAAGGRRPC